MALSDASRLADFATGVGTDGTLAVNNLDASGVVTATSFVGNGSGLTGVASTDNIITSTASTFTGNVWVGAAVSISGITTVYNTAESTNSANGAVVISGGVGIAKSLNVGGNLSVGGTLTYEDVTRIDSVGIVTAGGGLYVGRTEGGGTGIAVTITTDGNADFGKTGIITASSFEGSGAKLTGLPAGFTELDSALFN